MTDDFPAEQPDIPAAAPRRWRSWWLFTVAFVNGVIVAVPVIYMAAFAGRADWYQGGYQLDLLTVCLLLVTGGVVGLSWLAAPISWEHRIPTALVTTVSVAYIAGLISAGMNT